MFVLWYFSESPNSEDTKSQKTQNQTKKEMAEEEHKICDPIG